MKDQTEVKETMMEKLMTTGDVAEATRSTIDTVRYWRSAGIGPSGFRVGKKVLYREADVIAWIESKSADTAGISL